MMKRAFVSLLIGSILSGVPALVVLATPEKATGRWFDWVAVVWVPGAFISRWVLRLQPHDRPFVVWSVVLSSFVYAAVCGLLLSRRCR